MNDNTKGMPSLLSPDIQTIYLGTGTKQSVRFLRLNNDFDGDILREDISHGAGIYEPFLKTLELQDTRFNIITAKAEEDGLRAVTYLAGIHAVLDGYKPEQITDQERNMYRDEKFSTECDIEEDSIDFDEFDSDHFDPIDDDDDYMENFDRIPIIGISEVMSLNNNDQNFGFTPFSMEMINNTKNPAPWWLACRSEAVCIIKNDASSDFFWVESVLCDEEIKCLNRFKHNRRVYLLVVADDIKDDDFSVNTAMLEYTANCFRINCESRVLSSYYRTLFRSVVAKYGFTFSKDVDVALLAEQLSSIDKQFPCDRFEKIMQYMIHLGASHELSPSDFDNLGLKKLIEKGQNKVTSQKMDEELVGMENVKNQIKNIIHMLKYVKVRKGRGVKGSGFHNVHLFVGAPGTAKTTIARMMMKMMQEEGLIPGNRFVSVTGAQLKGAYVGQTAPKVHDLFKKNDAIFIDEAYSLTSGSDSLGGVDSYSQEALAQLAVELEEHAMDRLVIFAGYGGNGVNRKNNLMHKFLTANPGISSRINSTICFDSYTPEDMVKIVHRLAKNESLILPDSEDGLIRDYFEKRCREEDFGNGREGRVLLEMIERNVAERVSSIDIDEVTDSELNTVKRQDIINALNEIRLERKGQKGEYGKLYGIA